jgi:hypothetical protein
MYLAGWAERVPDESWNHRLMGIIDPFQPFLKDLGPFLMRPPPPTLHQRPGEMWLTSLDDLAIIVGIERHGLGGGAIT